MGGYPSNAKAVAAGISAICSSTSPSQPQRVVWWVASSALPPKDGAAPIPGMLNMLHTSGAHYTGDVGAWCPSDLRQVRNARRQLGTLDVLEIATESPEQMNPPVPLTYGAIRNDIMGRGSCSGLKDRWGRSAVEPDSVIQCYKQDPSRQGMWMTSVSAGSPAAQGRRAGARDVREPKESHITAYDETGPYSRVYSRSDYEDIRDRNSGVDRDPAHNQDDEEDRYGLQCHQGAPRVWHAVVFDDVQAGTYEMWLSGVNRVFLGSKLFDGLSPCGIGPSNHGFFQVAVADGRSQCSAVHPSQPPAALNIPFLSASSVANCGITSLASRATMYSGFVCPAGCETGHAPIGSLQCLNGSWTAAAFRCVPEGAVCQLPGGNGTAGNNLAIDPSIVGVSGAECGALTPAGTACSYTCDTENQRGVPTSRRAEALDGAKIVCTASGHWAPGENYQPCPAPSCAESADILDLTWRRGEGAGQPMTPEDDSARQEARWYDLRAGGPGNNAIFQASRSYWYSRFAPPRGAIEASGPGAFLRGGKMWKTECADIGSGNRFCATCRSKHCAVYAFVWHQPPLSRGLDGGLADLVHDGWTPRGRCGPRFWDQSEVLSEGEFPKIDHHFMPPVCVWPMLALRKDLSCGESTCIDQQPNTTLQHFAIAATRRKNCGDNSLDNAIDCEKQELYHANTCKWMDGRCVEHWCGAPLNGGPLRTETPATPPTATGTPTALGYCPAPPPALHYSQFAGQCVPASEAPSASPSVSPPTGAPFVTVNIFQSCNGRCNLPQPPGMPGCQCSPACGNPLIPLPSGDPPCCSDYAQRCIPAGSP